MWTITEHVSSLLERFDRAISITLPECEQQPLEPEKVIRQGKGLSEWQHEVACEIFGTEYWNDVEHEANLIQKEMEAESIPFRIGGLACQWCGTVPAKDKCLSCGGPN